MKKFICLVLAVLLVAASVAVLYSDVMYRLFDKEQVNEFYDNLGKNMLGDEEQPAENGGIEKLGLDFFPLYPSIYNLFVTYVPAINDGDVNELTEAGNAAKEMTKQEDFLTALYNLLIIALLSIPVYMLFRFIPFNTLYAAADNSFVLARPLYRGLVCCACSIVTITGTWFLYHSAIYETLYKKLIDWVQQASAAKFAINITNIVIIAVIAIALIAILKRTVFRGSIVKSVLLAVLRGVLFVIVFGLANAFIAVRGFTWYAVLFAVLFVIVVGIVDMLLDPAKENKKAA